MKALLYTCLFATCLLSISAKAQIAGDKSVIGITSMAISGNTMYAGTALNGVYMSTDAGANWQPFGKGLRDKWEVFAIGEARGAVLVQLHDDISSNRNEIWLKRAGSDTWEQLFKGKDISGGPFAIVASFKGILFAGTQYEGLSYSSDAGASWQLVPGQEKVWISEIAANEKVLITKDYNKIEGLSGTEDGVNWFPIKKDPLVRPDKVEAHGNYIICRFCNFSFSKGDYRSCRSEVISVYNEKKKKFVAAEMGARFYGFDGGDIYTITVIKPRIKKTMKADYIKKFWKSTDGGKSWKEIDSTNEYIRTSPQAQSMLAELDAWKAEEIEDQEISIAAAARAVQAMQDRKMEMRRQSRGYVPSGGGSSSGSSTDYRALSNDRFKEHYNHRDSWIDSKGQIHSN